MHVYCPDLHVQTRGIVQENVHTAVALRKGKQTSGPQFSRSDDIIYKSKKQDTWAEAHFMNSFWFESDGIATARACVLPTHSFLQPIQCEELQTLISHVLENFCCTQRMHYRNCWCWKERMRRIRIFVCCLSRWIQWLLHKQIQTMSIFACCLCYSCGFPTAPSLCGSWVAQKTSAVDAATSSPTPPHTLPCVKSHCTALLLMPEQSWRE